jgi:hypothetical protein
MALMSTSRPSIRARVLSRLPATMTAAGGFKIAKVNGIWTFSPDFGALALVSSISDPGNTQVWVFNAQTGAYSRMTVSAFVSALAQTGAGYAIMWTFDASTADADPGAGKIRFNNSAQSSTTQLFVDLLDAGGMDWTTVIDSFDDATNAVKGNWSLTKVGEASRRLVGTLSAWTTASGYRKLTVAVTGSSSSNPFANGDPLLFAFVRAGDSGGGDVAGPGSSTDNTLPRFDGATGKLLQAGSMAVADDGKATVNLASAATSSVEPVARLSHATSGTPAAGIGAALEFEVETAGGNMEVGARIDAVTTDVNSATEDFDLVVRLMAAGAAVAEKLRILSTGVAYLAGNAARVILHAAGGTTLTGGFDATPFDAGTKSTGTYTPAPADGNLQRAINGGAHTLAPPASDCSIVIQYTNNASAGAITTSGFTKKTGDTITTTNGDDFLFYVTRLNSFSHLHVVALQ